MKFLWVFLLTIILGGLSTLTQAQQAADERHTAFGLNGIADWSTQHPFIDVMKSARPWFGHLHGQWGGMAFEEVRDSGVLDTNGWPTRIPAAASKLETVILTDQPEDALHLSGRYVLMYEGQGSLSLTGRARVIKSEPGLRVFSYRPGPDLVGIVISETDSDDPIRNIRVIPEKHLEAYKAGQVFNPDWLARLGKVDLIRFMDWAFTNGSTIKTWSDMPSVEDFSYAWRGVPLPLLIDLANSIGADPWFNIPHLAEDDLVKRYAQMVRDGLDPERTAYVEYSNEVWNFVFEQAQWSGQQAERVWGETNDGWMQFYGVRAASVMKIWTDVFGVDGQDRLMRVVGVHTGWPELEQSILFGDRATDILGYPPVEMFDAYAVTGYFGADLGEPAALADAFDAAEDEARKEGEAKGLSRVALREFVRQNRFEGLNDMAADMVRRGSLKELTEYLWPYHAGVAAQHGLKLVMYEGGTHAVAAWEVNDDERLVEFLTAFSYSEQMADLYREAIGAWSRLTDSPFNAFVDVAGPSKWGSWGALRHLDDDNPRWRVLRGIPPDPAAE